MQLYIALSYSELLFGTDCSNNMSGLLSGRILGFSRTKETYRKRVPFGKCSGMSGFFIAFSILKKDRDLSDSGLFV